MNRISIGDTERDLEGAPESWIREHVEDLRRLGKPVCVEITLHSGSVNMILSTPGCGPVQGGGHEANRQEMKILELWKKKGLNDDNFNVKELIDFVERVDII
jgi:hypothetical protein